MATSKHALFAAAFAVTLAPAAPVMAGADDIVGGIIGGVIAGGIMSHQQKKTTKVYRAPAVSSATREQNRQVQNSLNYFGFPVGTADGVLGSRSRAAKITKGFPFSRWTCRNCFPRKRSSPSAPCSGGGITSVFP